MAEVKIEVREVGKVFFDPAKGAETVALEKTTFQIRDQEIISLLGPSGCGKTTIINIIAGFEGPSRGQVILRGKEVSQPGRDRGVIFQEESLFPWLAVEDNISFGLRMMGRDPKEYREAVRRLIGLVGLTGFEGHYPHELSGGMKQRVAIARVLVNEPEVLLMDEPFGSLDSQTRVKMQQLLLKVWEQLKPTILFVTHDVDEAIYLGDRILVMTARPGRIKADIRVPIGRPRAYEIVTSEEYVEIKRKVLKLMEEESGDW